MKKLWFFSLSGIRSIAFLYLKMLIYYDVEFEVYIKREIHTGVEETNSTKSERISN